MWLVIAGVVLAWWSSRNLPKREERPPLQPKDAAFGVAWLVIFTALLATAWRIPPTSAILVTASLACSAAWAVSWKRAWTRTATACIWAATALAWAAAGCTEEVAVGLYAGWLSVASVLVLPAVPHAALPVLSTAVALLSTWTGAEAAPVAVAWATLMQRSGAPPLALVASLLACGAGIYAAGGDGGGTR